MADRAHSAAWAAGVRSAAAYRGAMGPELAGREYAGQLTDADLRLLASVAAGRAGTGPSADGSWLRGDPAALLAVLEHPGTFDAVIGQDEAAAGWTGLASPFLVFAVFVQRAATELAAAGHGPGRPRARQRGALFRGGAPPGVLGGARTAAVPGRAAGLLYPGGQRPLPVPGGRAAADPAVQRAGPGAAGRPAGGGAAGRAAGRVPQAGRRDAVLDRRLPRLRRH